MAKKTRQSGVALFETALLLSLVALVSLTGVRMIGLETRGNLEFIAWALQPAVLDFNPGGGNGIK